MAFGLADVLALGAALAFTLDFTGAFALTAAFGAAALLFGLVGFFAADFFGAGFALVLLFVAMLVRLLSVYVIEKARVLMDTVLILLPELSLPT